MCKKCLYLFTVFLLIAVVFLPTEYATAEDPEPTIWSDEFDGVLDLSWYWINEITTGWNMDTTGFLTIDTSTVGTGDENLLLRGVTEGDFSIETRLLFEPTSNFQFAGLVIFMDADNFLQFGRAYCGYLDFGCVGNGIYFDYVLNDQLSGDNFATAVGNQAEAFLRLERRGGQIKGFYSNDGNAWIEIGTHWIPEESMISGVGLTSSNNQEGMIIPAYFDYFELSEGLSAIPSQMIWADPHHNAINAWGWDNEEEISLQIWDPEGTDVTPVESMRVYAEDSGAAWNSDELGIDLQGGYTIQMTGNISFITKTLVVTPLEVQAYDFNQNMISGIFDPDLPLAIHLGENRRFSFTTEGDTWGATFVEMPYGAGGEVWQTDEDGDMTGIGMWVPSPRLTVSITDDWFRAEDFPRGAEVTVTIYNDPGDSEPWQEGRTTDENGFLFVGGWEFERDLTPGMVVEVSHALVTKSIVLEPISMFVVDEDNDYLAGKAPAERDLWVGAGNEFEGYGFNVPSNSEGYWSADFFAEGFDIQADMWKAVQVFDEDWDATEANPGFPRGSHDYDNGDVPDWACNAGGWVMDPDDQTRPVDIRILSDGVEVYSDSITGFGFQAHLWDIISSYEPHELLVEAYDLESETWYPLENSPRTLICRTQDIYSFDPQTGLTTQVTDLRDTNEYNPAWSPSGRLVAYDVTPLDHSSSNLYVTDTVSGFTYPLTGTDGGNDAVWAPNGLTLVFDRRTAGDDSLYEIPFFGGKSKLIKQDAISADFSPDGKYLVYQKPSDGSLRIMPVISKGKETIIANFGEHPVWSPDGNWIAFQMDGDIWKVKINAAGKAMGGPIQLTSSPFGDGMPTWTADSQNIIYHTGLSRDYDLWKVPADGGMPEWLAGAPEFGDYDPSVSKATSLVAYSSFSPEGQAARTWVAAFTYDPDLLSIGEHSYSFGAEGVDPTGGSGLNVSEYLPTLYDGFVLFRPWGLVGRLGEDWIDIEDATIRPDQPIRLMVGWTADGIYQDAVNKLDALQPKAYLDGVEFLLFRHEVFPFSASIDWQQYIFSFTW